MHGNDQTLYPPWGKVTPDFWAGATTAPAVSASAPQPASVSHAEGEAFPAHLGPEGTGASGVPSPEARVSAGRGPEAPPATHQGQITAVNQAISDGRLTDAEALAHDLEQQMAAAYGDQHEYTAHVREMQAHIAHLTGDHVSATMRYLSVTTARAHTLGLGDPLTQASAHRAGATWQAITDPAELVRLSDAILAMLTDVTGETSKATRGARAFLARRTR